MLKNILLAALTTISLSATAQNSIEYHLCDQDFRALNMRNGLPANAVYLDDKATAEVRASDLVKRMTFDEKLMMTGGWKIMHYPALERLGLPPVYFSDASQGIHVKNHCVKVGKSTAFPATLALAATWNTDLAYEYAKAIGEECRYYGISVLLGPGMNMYRNSEGGRNFEYFGEDPKLVTDLSVSYVKGLQSTGTLATIKHFIGNEQEFARHVIDVKIGERALREIYLPPFKASIEEAGALAVMTGNNLVNGYPGAANEPMSQGILRSEYGFKGIIMSDWANSMFWEDRQELELTSGHSLLMADNKIFAKWVVKEVKEHHEKKGMIERHLDTMVKENLYSFFKGGVYDRPYRDPSLANTFETHKKIARQTAEEAITLLKNDDNILPLVPAKVKKLVMLGADDALKAYVGKGSGKVEGYDQVDYITGLKNVYGEKIISGDAVNDDAIRSADAIFYFSTKQSREGIDFDFDEPDLTDSLSNILDINKNVIVVHSGGNGFAMPWIDKVKGFMFCYLLGQEAGTALANVVSGEVSPSGKLPFTIEKDFKDSPAKDYNKMKDGKYYWKGGKPNSKAYRETFGSIETEYTEGIFTGYRWYDKKKIPVLFPFGFGLSYSTFKIKKTTISSNSITHEKPVRVTCTVSNTGNMDGAEVVQLYVHDVKSSVEKAKKELKAYKKVFLKAGESKEISMEIKLSDLAYWDVNAHTWKTEKGEYLLEIGNSSQNLSSGIAITH